jgi:uncharacterized protein YcbX
LKIMAGLRRSPGFPAMIVDVPRPPRVVSLYRYPVKSLTGESVTRLEVDQRGCVGDRQWSVRTEAGKIGSGKNSQRFAAIPGLLDVRAFERDGRVAVTFPDGSSCFVDDAEAAARLSQYVGQPVSFASETSVSHFDDGPISLIGQASVDAVTEEQQDEVDPARFRANIHLATAAGPFVEDAWLGRQLRIGTATVQVEMTSPRCVMVNMATADLPAQPGNLTAIGRINNACLGVIAKVMTPGVISLGDELTIS